jgi:hypothetical protein
MTVRFPDIEVQLSGEDGNAFVIMGAVTKAMRRANKSADDIEKFRKEALSGNYDHLLQTCMRWVHVS